MHRWEYGDPAMVLERRGEDCTGCEHLTTMDLSTLIKQASVTYCVKLKPQAPERRCGAWRHKDAGQYQTGRND